MKISNKVSLAILSASVFLGLVGPIVAHAAPATSPPLGDAASYSVLSGTKITNTGTTAISGDVGISPTGGGNYPGLTAGMVGPPGTIHDSDTPAADAQSAQKAVFDGPLDFVAQPCSPGKTYSADTELSTLGGTGILDPGVYCTGPGYDFLLSGTLTLHGTGSPATDVWIFRSSRDLLVTSDTAAKVVFSGTGGLACNVWWRIAVKATFDGANTMVGNILAAGLISFGTGATLDGRAFSYGAAVTLLGNTISGPTCAAAAVSLGSSSINVPIFPLINVTKIPSPLNLPAGPGPVTYTYKVTNIGIVPVANVSVKDNMCSPTHFVSGDTNKDGILDLTETWTYNCFKTVSQTETNTVTACGSAVNTTSSGSMCDTAQATVVVGVPLTPPLIHLVKTPSTFLLPAGGGLVTYQYYITNPGTVPLSDVSISDDKCVAVRLASHAGDVNGNNLLDSGETWHFSCVENLTQTTTNIGTATGHANGFTAVDDSFAMVVVAPPVIVPKLPSAGLPPYGTSTPLDAALAGGILMMVLASLAVIQKKRKV